MEEAGGVDVDVEVDLSRLVVPVDDEVEVVVNVVVVGSEASPGTLIDTLLGILRFLYAIHRVYMIKGSQQGREGHPRGRPANEGERSRKRKELCGWFPFYLGRLFQLSIKHDYYRP